MVGVLKTKKERHYEKTLCQTIFKKIGGSCKNNSFKILQKHV